MALQKFSWQLDMGASSDTQFAVNKVQFGDGYTQYSTHGINNKRKAWSGTKTGDLATVIQPIMDFIDSTQGVTPFLWMNPHGQTKQYTCGGYSTPQRKGNFWQISLKFEPFFG